MSHLPFTDREVERVLAGQQPYGRPELAEVAYFVARLRTLADFEPPPEMSPELRAQVEAAEARQLEQSEGRGRPGASRRRSRGATVPDDAVGVVRLDARRRSAGHRGPRRWQLVGAAAAVVAIGVVATTISLLGGGGSTPEVQTENAGVTVDTTTTTTAPTTTVAEPPAASSGESSGRPTVPTQPPDTVVDTTQVPTETTDDDRSHDGDGDPPRWVEDFWPSECDWPDWDCTCDQFESTEEREWCRDLAEQFSRGDGDGGDGGDRGGYGP